MQRIKRRIDEIKNIFTTGIISIIIKTLISWMTTLEISNGREKVTIQDILREFEYRLNILDNSFKELEYITDQISKGYMEGKIDDEIMNFKTKIYKLFSLYDIVQTILNKCVTLGWIGNRITIIQKELDILTKETLDVLFGTETDDECIGRIYYSLEKHLDYISDKKERKIYKIKILTKILQLLTDEDEKHNDTMMDEN